MLTDCVMDGMENLDRARGVAVDSETPWLTNATKQRSSREEYSWWFFDRCLNLRTQDQFVAVEGIRKMKLKEERLIGKRRSHEEREGG